MIKAHVSTVLDGPISYPFMWASDYGCVYLRNTEGQDIIIGPRVCDGKLGKVVEQNVSPQKAWSRRLAWGTVLTLEQAQ